MESRTATSEEDKVKLANKAQDGDTSQDGRISGSAAKEPEGKDFMSKLKGLWTGLDLDVPTVLTMMKGGLPPAISMAMYDLNMKLLGI